jgi:hypothetical protein
VNFSLWVPTSFHLSQGSNLFSLAQGSNLFQVGTLWRLVVQAGVGFQPFSGWKPLALKKFANPHLNNLISPDLFSDYPSFTFNENCFATYFVETNFQPE